MAIFLIVDLLKKTTEDVEHRVKWPSVKISQVSCEKVSL